MSLPQPPPGKGHPQVSLDDAAFFHVEPHPVLPRGPVALPVGVSLVVCQVAYFEVILEERNEQREEAEHLWANHSHAQDGFSADAHLLAASLKQQRPPLSLPLMEVILPAAVGCLGKLCHSRV